MKKLIQTLLREAMFNTKGDLFDLDQDSNTDPQDYEKYDSVTQGVQKLSWDEAIYQFNNSIRLGSLGFRKGWEIEPTDAGWEVFNQYGSSQGILPKEIDDALISNLKFLYTVRPPETGKYGDVYNIKHLYRLGAFLLYKKQETPMILAKTYTTNNPKLND